MTRRIFWLEKWLLIKGKLLTIPFWLRLIAIICIVFFALFILYDFIFPYKADINYSQIVLSSEGKIIHAFLNDDDKWRIKTELHEVSPEMRKAIMFKEDKYFRYHPGVNPVSIIRSLIKNTVRRDITSGASTITMQLTRMLSPAERTYINKFKEIIRALQLELHYSKDDIFLMYLNLIPYGGNIEGIKTASLLFFDQKPEALSLARIIELSIIPNDPNRLNPLQKPEILYEKRIYWLNYFARKNVFSEKMIEDAMLEESSYQRSILPSIAPHLSRLLKMRYPDKSYIQSTIDYDKQMKAEQIVNNYIQPLKRMGISNAALIVINNTSKEVEVYVASADFHDNASQGQVDGIRAIRSPGSALKPLLYAIAFDKGIVTPKTVINDIAVNYSGYMPENYDGNYHGSISIEKALSLSLNIPAVKILDQMGVDVFVNKLSQSGFSTIHAKRHELGYSVTLGGCGLSLLELTRAYSAFASGGVISDPIFCKRENSSIIDTLCSKAAVFMITEILSSPKRADMPANFENSLYLPRIAWKTGTSYGRRDAWAIGYNSEYTIGVWMGNFPGIGVPELNGTEYAVPLLFSIFNTLKIGSSEHWFPVPAEVDFRLVCSETGQPPSDFCTDFIMDAFIPAVSKNTACQHLIEVAIDKDEKISYCKSCLPERGYKKKYYKNHPSELIAFFQDEFIPYQKIPPHNPKCKRIYAENAPKIISLTNGMEYLLFKDGSQKLMLRCAAENGVEHVYWYINNKLLYKARATEKVFFTPSEGETKISCTDDKGRNRDIFIRVNYL